MKKIKKNVLKPLLFICLGLIITTIAVASVVFDRPTPPRDPVVSDKTSTSCVLTYKAPYSDGGTPIVNYTIKSRYAYSGTWVNRGSSTGLVHTVRNLTPGSEVVFRIFASNEVGESDPVETDFVTLPE